MLPHQPGPSRLQLSFCLPPSAPTPLHPLSGHSPTFPEDFSLGLQIAFPFFPLHIILSNFTGCDGASGILTLLTPTYFLMTFLTAPHQHLVIRAASSEICTLSHLPSHSFAVALRPGPPPPTRSRPSTYLLLLLFLDPASTWQMFTVFFLLTA